MERETAKAEARGRRQGPDEDDRSIGQTSTIFHSSFSRAF
jgi:hypothetical protein